MQCKAVQNSAARQARRSCRRVVQLGAATERTATAEKSPLVDDAQAGSAAGNRAMSRHNRPVKAVTGHREMRPIHLDRPRARLPVDSRSHEAPAPRLRPQWIHAPYAAARARGLAASRERRLGACSNPQNFSAVVFGRGFLLEVENTRPEKGFSARRHGKRTERHPGRRNDTPPPSGRATTPRGTDTHRRRPDAPPNYGGKTGEGGFPFAPQATGWPAASSGRPGRGELEGWGGKGCGLTIGAGSITTAPRVCVRS